MNFIDPLAPLIQNHQVNTIPIIGTGSLAIGIAYLLRRAGYAPRLIGREGPLEIAGFKLKGFDETLPIHFPQASAAEIQSAQICFVAVKAYQLKLALVQHLPRFKDGAAIIPVGNGAIDRELIEVAAEFPKLLIRLGITTLAVSDEGKGKLAMRNATPQTLWGRLKSQDVAIQTDETELTESGSGYFKWNDSISLAYRKKWLFNTVLNSLCGVFTLPKNGEALKHSKAMMRAFAEAYSLAEEHWGEWPEAYAAEGLFSELLALVETTYENENSMARDRRLGRPTETAYLAGVSRAYEGYPFLKELDDKLRGETL